MSPKNIHKTSKNSGFSLIQISVMIGVAGIILASLLPGGDLGSNAEKERITKEKMTAIETATQSFMAANLRRPCPADGTLATSSANFGKEDSTPGRCSGSNFYTQSTPVTKTGATTTASSAVATTLSDTTGLTIGMLVTGTNIANDTHILSVDSATQITLDKYAAGASGTLTFTSVVAGVVPTKTLGLSDDYMFDGYGRRIGYVVDTRATDQGTCRNMWATKTSGAIQIMDYSTATYTTDNVMWSLISYGKDGYGAFPMQGSSIANRINSGATSDDEEINAFVNTSDSFATSFTQKLVKHDPITTMGSTYFDDMVWTQESTKNTCCTGKVCQMGTRIDGAILFEGLGTNIALGDINGDGIPDMVGSTSGSSGSATIRVVFGSATGWSPNAGMATGTANSSRFITITNDSAHPNFAGSVAVGDINGDGYDDIAIGYGDGTSSAIKVFYGSATPVSTNISAITNIITFPTTGSAAPSIVLGNFANTTKKDIFALIKTASGTGNSTGYVIYGASSYSLTAEAVTTVTGTNGFKVDSTSPGRMEAISGIGDVNNDGYDDIIISNYTNNILYVIFGQSIANWNAPKTAATGSTPDIVNIDTLITTGVTRAIKFTNGGTNIGRYTIAVADINGDGTYKDIIFNNGNYFYVYYGKTAASWAAVDLSTASNYNGTNGFRFDVVTTDPAWLTDPMTKALVADVDADGKNDVIFTDNNAGPNSLMGSGSSFVVLQPGSGWSSIWTSGTLTLFAQVFNATGTGLPLNSDVSKGYRIDGYASLDGTKILAVADINNDGSNDLIIGAPVRVSFAGSVYILFGKTLVPWDASTNLGLLN